MRRAIWHSGGAAVALVLMVGAARGDIVAFDATATCDASSARGAAETVLTVPRFDPSLGTMTVAEFDVTYNLVLSGTLTNLDPTRPWPGGPPILLYPYLVVDFGISGPVFHEGPALRTSLMGADLQRPLAPLEDRHFTGRAGGYYDFGLSFDGPFASRRPYIEGVGTVPITVGGAPLGPFDPVVMEVDAVRLVATVSGSYTYTPAVAAPEPSTFGLAGIGGLALLLGYARRPRRAA